MKVQLGERPCAIVRQLRLRLRRAGSLAYLVCAWCGRSGDIERRFLDLSAAGINHSQKCPVARTLRVNRPRSFRLAPRRAA